ncbi:MAG: alpha/beta hydrolase-fold protein [Candidatus Promineifilaceae bacterium]|nr:alpha/beta hydrolase-fold protein [Candidatus Promineifilaceae bacterium]
MNREYHRWYSPSLGRDMQLLIFGHAGARLLVFPTSMGRFYEWEDRGMAQALRHQIEQGWLQMYCIDSVDKESWYARWKHPNDRARHQTAYENYITREVLPLSRQKNNNSFLITTGASFGAYHAVNFALRHPHLVDRTIGLSGFYDITKWADGYTGGEVYFHNPVAYIPNEHNPGRLAALRRLDIVLAVGRDDSLADNNRNFSHLLWQKGIWNALRVWDGWCHDWPYWTDMLRHYISGSD